MCYNEQFVNKRMLFDKKIRKINVVTIVGISDENG
jgi:hypothetical protein